ncbi:hypothetical protein AVEN_97610-1 [Araneus ventricosus]|uniref:Uncharacterized protein n=1 Tax=Araneus ventricosus TaxID=182803 RepID=A0A4Y2GHF0_ARAVE|nr:hypothetical protein AVEN_97610-1 [Araneus ventricosus]
MPLLCNAAWPSALPRFGSRSDPGSRPEDSLKIPSALGPVALKSTRRRTKRPSNWCSAEVFGEGVPAQVPTLSSTTVQMCGSSRIARPRVLNGRCIITNQDGTWFSLIFILLRVPLVVISPSSKPSVNAHSRIFYQ